MKIFSLLIFLSLTLTPLHAATDDVLINLTVTDSGSGGNNPPGGDNPNPDPIRGCTDPAADNYSAAAQEDDDSCVYEIQNVSNFSAVYNQSQNQVNLSWQNPNQTFFQATRIMRGTSGFPTNPTSGILIYEGAGKSANDLSVTIGTTYYYTAFAKNTFGEYASGAVVMVTPTAPVNEPPEEGEEPPPEDPGVPNEAEPAPDPFANLPQVEPTDPLVQQLNLTDFIFSQPRELAQIFRSGGLVSLVPKKEVTVSIDYDKLPESLKTIGLTLINTANRSQTHSFILRTNADKSLYLAKLPPVAGGTYELFIYVIDFQDQSLKRLTGRVVVAGAGFISLPPILKTVTQKIISPILVTVGLATGLVEGLALTSRLNSLYDLYLLFGQLLNLFLQRLGLKKKYKPWGVVYDAITKRPLDPAYVVVRKKGDDLNTAITDLDGRYGFFLPAGTYTLIANKTHYQFPSAKLAGKTRDELYDNLYFGGEVESSGEETINQNIPLDPTAFDWNEFAKNQQGYFILNLKKELWRQRLFASLFYLGLFLTFYKSLVAPTILNLVVLGLYVAMIIFKSFWHYHRPVTSVKNAETGLPLSFAIIRAFVPDVNQQVKSVVADAMGRFFLLTPPGEYYLIVEEKLPDGTYKKVHQTPVLKLDRGVVTNDIIAQPSRFITSPTPVH